MQRIVSFGRTRQKRHLASFTLIELLTVIAIIVILAALTLGVAAGVRTMAARSRAKAEILALSTGIEGYKTDNSVLPALPAPATPNFSTNSYATENPSQSGSKYQAYSQVLYEALSGKTNFGDPDVAGLKSYFPFKAGQIGNPTATGAAASSYVQDPWGYSYGYATGDATHDPYNGNGFYDLWSTGGWLPGTTPAGGNDTNTWIMNWK